MQWKHLMCAALSCAPLVFAQDESTVTASDLIRQAADRNREVLALRERVREAQGLLRQAGLKPAASLETSGLTGRPLATVGEEEYSAGYVLPIERGGKRDKRLRVAEFDVALAEADIAERLRQLAFDVKIRYAEAAAEVEKKLAVERLIALSQDFLRLTDARVQEGDAAPLDRDLWKVELAREQVLQASIVGRAEAALTELRRATVLDLAPSVLSPLSLPDTRVVLAEAQQRGLSNRPDLRRARLEEEQAGAAVDLAEAQGTRDVTLAARYARRNAQFDDQRGFNNAGVLVPLRDRDDVVSVSMSIPLWGRNRNLGNMQAANARAASERLQREHLEAVIPLEVEAAWRRYRSSTEVVNVLKDGVLAQSERNLVVMREAYELGQLRLLDLVTEQRRLIETRLSFIDSQLEVARAFAELERAAGGTLP